MNSKSTLYFCLLFIWSVLAQSQSTEPLTAVIKKLQERYDVQFNYASTVVENIVVDLPNDFLTLEECLKFLNNRSDLEFIRVSNKIVTIRGKPKRLCGYLKDKDTGEPLPYVTIQSSINATIANEEGYFELDKLNENDVIRIKHLGFQPLKREVALFNPNDCDTISLVPFEEKLEEVIVSDFLIRGIDKLNNGSVELDFDQFSILPGLIEDDVLQTIQALPGIQSVDETVSNINIRGGSNDQNLITWDDIKMYQSGHFFGLISMYNPDITQKVELRKNGSEASETDGVSGTIAMKTDEYLNSEFTGSIGVNLIDANGYADIPLGKKASLQIAARKALSDFAETPTYSNYFKRISQDTEIERNSDAVMNSDIAFDFYDTSFRLLYIPTDKDRLRINFIYTANEVIFNENAEVNQENEIRESELNQNSIAVGVFYKREWSENFNTFLSVYNTDYKLDAKNANILDNQRFLQENKVSETGIKVKFLNKIGSRINLVNGYNYVETKVTNLDNVDNPLYLLLEGEVLQTHSVFSEIRVSSKDSKTTLNAGLRLNYLDKLGELEELDGFTKQLWEPRFSFNQILGKYAAMEILGEFKHQSTSQVINFQNDFLGLEKRRWQLANNQSIPIITSKQMSLGLNYNKNGWLINVVPFFKQVDGITSQSQGFQGPYEFSRTSGYYNATGLDVLFRKQFQNNSMWVSYAFLNSDYFFNEPPPETDLPTNFSNNYNITHGLTAGGNYAIGKLLFALGVNWRTGKPFTKTVLNEEVVDGKINYNSVNENKLRDYLRLDFSTIYNFNWGENNKMQMGLSIWNILDRNNIINTFYRLNSSEELANRINQNSLGITPNFSLKFLFD